MSCARTCYVVTPGVIHYGSVIMHCDAIICTHKNVITHCDVTVDVPSNVITQTV